jgi:hypothetical protein
LLFVLAMKKLGGGGDVKVSALNCRFTLSVTGKF